MNWHVNGEPVDDAAVRDEARRMRSHYMESVSGMDPVEAEIQLREWARENMIERILLRQEAQADPEPVPAETIEKALQATRDQAGGQAGCGTRTTDEEIRKQIEIQYRIERLISRVQSKASPPKSKDVADYYKKNRERFWTPELVHAAHVVKNVNEQQDEASARTAIEAAYAELQEGVEFAAVADKYSDCGGNGGDLGWFPRGQMVDEFEAVVFDLQPGALSGIFRSGFGFHIAKLYERKPEGLRSFNEVKDQIESGLWQEKRNKALEEHLDRLRAKAKIEQSKVAS